MPSRDVAIISFAQSDHVRAVTNANEVEMLMPVAAEALKRAGMKKGEIGFTCSGSTDYLAGTAFSQSQPSLPALPRLSLPTPFAPVPTHCSNWLSHLTLSASSPSRLSGEFTQRRRPPSAATPGSCLPSHPPLRLPATSADPFAQALAVSRRPTTAVWSDVGWYGEHCPTFAHFLLHCPTSCSPILILFLFLYSLAGTLAHRGALA
jgi:hypothetical protein